MSNWGGHLAKYCERLPNTAPPAHGGYDSLQDAYTGHILGTSTSYDRLLRTVDLVRKQNNLNPNQLSSFLKNKFNKCPMPYFHNSKKELRLAWGLCHGVWFRLGTFQPCSGLDRGLSNLAPGQRLRLISPSLGKGQLVNQVG